MMSQVKMCVSIMILACGFVNCGGSDCDNPNPAYDATDPTSQSCLDLPETNSSNCIPGTQQECACGGVYQECKEDGSGFTSCECVGDCAALVECHIGLQEVALNVSGLEKSDSVIRSECETLVIDDYGNDEAACSVGLEDLSCP